MGGAAGKVDATGLQLHYKEEIECGQAALDPDFHGGEIDGSHHVPMRLQECFPRSCAFTRRCRLDSVGFEDVANGGVADAVAEVR